MKCLDTYPLIEIALGNEKFASLLNEDVIITTIITPDNYTLSKNLIQAAAIVNALDIQDDQDRKIQLKIVSS